jgi:flagellar basal-body rod protein FlgC
VVFQSEPVEAQFGSMFDAEMRRPETGVAVSETIVDQRDPERRYMPGHPDAGPDGYVAFPRLNPVEEMVDLMGASHGYQANVASMSAIKEMIQRSIDLLR